MSLVFDENVFYDQKLINPLIEWLNEIFDLQNDILSEVGSDFQGGLYNA